MLWVIYRKELGYLFIWNAQSINKKLPFCFKKGAY
jgi:hypothetical protein